MMRAKRFSSTASVRFDMASVDSDPSKRGRSPRDEIDVVAEVRGHAVVVSQHCSVEIPLTHLAHAERVEPRLRSVLVKALRVFFRMSGSSSRRSRNP